MEPAEVAAVVKHMNATHRDDSLLICRTLGGEPEAEAARMVDLDASHGTFVATVGGTDRPVLVPWGAPVIERQDAREQIVALYREACLQAGIEPRGEGSEASEH